MKHEDYQEIYRSKLYELFFDTPVIKNELIRIFDIDNSNSKVYKVVISREDYYTRITVTEIFYKLEIEELPLSYVRYKNNIFLYYDGYEMILEKHMNKEELNKMLVELNIELKNPVSTYDTRMFQFDLLKEGKIKVNNPPIEPNDGNEEKFKFIKKE